MTFQPLWIRVPSKDRGQDVQGDLVCRFARLHRHINGYSDADWMAKTGLSARELRRAEAEPSKRIRLGIAGALLRAIGQDRAPFTRAVVEHRLPTKASINAAQRRGRIALANQFQRVLG